MASSANKVNGKSVRPCKLQYVSDSDDCASDFDDDSDSSGSDFEPMFSFSAERRGDSRSSESSESDEEVLLTSAGNAEKTDSRWKVCKQGTTQKNVSFAPSRTGVNIDVVPPDSTPLHCLHSLLTEPMIKAMMVLINDYCRNEFKPKDGEESADTTSNNNSNSEAGSGPPGHDDNTWEDMTIGEMYKFLLVLISMGVADPPAMKYFWTKNYIFSGSWFSKMLPQERFEKIYDAWNGVFDFNDVGKSKLKRFVKLLMKNCQAAFYPGKHLVVEEMVTSSKKGWAHVSYNDYRAQNYKVKTLGLVDNETSYIFNLSICYGPPNWSFNPNKLEPNKMNKLLDQLLSPCSQGHHLYLDKQYSSLPILQHLSEEKGFYYIGHVDEKRHNGIPQCLRLRKNKLEVGQIKWYMEEDNKNLIAQYRDTEYKRISALISNHAEVKTEFSQGMHMPAMFHEYNLTIKGCQRVHHLMERYGHYEVPVKDWKEKFLRWLLEIVQLNAFVLYKKSQPEDVKEVSYFKFKRILTNELCELAGKFYNEENPLIEDGKPLEECLCYRYKVDDVDKKEEMEDLELD